MPRLFFGNFDFEHQLAEPGISGRFPMLRKINAELACAWLAIADGGDVICTPEPFDPAFISSLAGCGFSEISTIEAISEISKSGHLDPYPEFCPWGWSSDMLSLAEAHNLPHRAPPLAAVRDANCRAFSFNLETEWNCGLHGAASLRSVDDLPRVLRAAGPLPSGWVLKARFGMSGRERLLGRGTEVSSATEHWLRKRLARDGVAIFEPWVEKIAEAGIQIEIPPSGVPELVGVTPLLTDAAGAYRGSRFGLADEDHAEWSEAVEAGLRAAGRIQALGYFGPLGIDAMRYRNDAGAIRLRPLQDINARYTMGRLSLGLRRLLQPGESGVWLHFRRPAEADGAIEQRLQEAQATLPSGARLIVTSPASVGVQPAPRASAVLIAPGSRELADAEQKFLAVVDSNSSVQ